VIAKDASCFAPWVSNSLVFYSTVKPDRQTDLQKNLMAKFKFRPLHDRVVVKRNSKPKKRPEGGIIIPDTAKESLAGEITAVGPGGRDEPAS